jgi:hypothetical protein
MSLAISWRLVMTAQTMSSLNGKSKFWEWNESSKGDPCGTGFGPPFGVNDEMNEGIYQMKLQLLRIFHNQKYFPFVEESL